MYKKYNEKNKHFLPAGSSTNKRAENTQKLTQTDIINTTKIILPQSQAQKNTSSTRYPFWSTMVPATCEITANPRFWMDCMLKEKKSVLTDHSNESRRELLRGKVDLDSRVLQGLL